MTRPYNSRKEPGKARDDYPTPDWIYLRLNETYDFNIDLAANGQNAKSDVWLGPDSQFSEDALSLAWSELPERMGVARLRGFLNPPFKGPNGQMWIGKWLEKCWQETRERGLVVALLPARTDAAWWHDWVILRASHWHFLRGRIQFDPDSTTGTNFGSAVVVYEPPLERDRPERRTRKKDGS